MLNPSHDSSPRHWETILESIDQEITQMAILCRTRLFDPGVIARIIERNDVVCGHKNPRAFEKLRALLIMHYTAHQRAAHELDDAQVNAIDAHIREHLNARMGGHLLEQLKT